ncbi:MAG: signal peptide peptidase SppA [Spirochaetaceae bacterium]|nr:MAG: signal peptide peptidase SppA [Spirochaetaceae bacterium]
MRYARIDLNGTYREIGAQTTGPLGVSLDKSFRLDHYLERVERIASTRSIRRVLVARGDRFSAPAFGALHEIRDGLLRIVAAGKEVVFYAPEYGAPEWYLASACTRRVLHPLGTVSFLGIARTGMFFRKLLEKLDIDVEVIRRGRYKSARDPFRTDRYDEYNREQLDALLAGVVDAMKQSVVESGVLTATQIEQMIAGRVVLAKEAEAEALVDVLATVDGIVAGWKTDRWKETPLKKVRGFYGKGARLRVLVFEGAVVDGENRRDPLLGQAIGDRSFTAAIRAVRDDKRAKAVVFRINSGGGSAVASENIVNELSRLAEKKPVVVSMGPVAGSGGYWIAMTGRRLFALPTSITGSIGVVTLFMNIAKLLARHGITTDTVKHGEYADFGSALRAMRPEEIAETDRVVDGLYREFLSRVAEFRGKTPEQIDKLGEGRVWLGNDALSVGLVDELGGLHDAIEYARDLIGKKKVRVKFGPSVKRSLVARLLTKRAAGVDSALLSISDANLTSPRAIARACRLIHGHAQFTDPILLAGGDFLRGPAE